MQDVYCDEEVKLNKRKQTVYKIKLFIRVKKQFV